MKVLKKNGKRPKDGYKFCIIDGCYTQLGPAEVAQNVCPDCEEAEDQANALGTEPDKSPG
jgi:hypothetical protein